MYFKVPLWLKTLYSPKFRIQAHCTFLACRVSLINTKFVRRLILRVVVTCSDASSYVCTYVLRMYINGVARDETTLLDT